MSSFSLRKTLAVTMIALLAWLGIRYLLPLMLPFLLGILLALAAEPLVQVCSRRLKLPRGAATGIGVTITLLLLTLVLLVLGALALRQLQALAARMPDLGQAAAAGLDDLQGWMLALADKAPESIRPLAHQGVEGLFDNGDLLLDKLTALVGSLASGIVTKLPDSALNIGTWLLSAFMFSARLPAIRNWLEGRFGSAWQQFRQLWGRLKKSVGGWFIAQCKLIAVTFGVLSLGFMLLRIENALLWAALISLADALPVLGTGVILAPWSLVCFIQGNSVRGVGLLGICAVAVLLRSILEPKLVGKQLGLDPLITLAAIYAGYRLWGLPGMVLSPLLAVTAVQLFSPRPEE